MKVNAGYSKNEDVVCSASGGVASYIASQFIKDGTVYGVRYDKDFKMATYDYAEEEKELQKFRGSKYCQTRKTVLRAQKEVSVYADVVDQLNHSNRVLFIGLGCDIGALKKYIEVSGISSDSLYTIELICDGVVPPKVQEKYVEELENRFSARVVEFNLRNKRYGWKLYNVYVRFENGKEYSCPFEDSDYGIAFKNYKQIGCYNCRYKQKHEGDLVIGDFWGCCEGMNTYNFNGVSLMIPLSLKGKEMMQVFDKGDFFIKEIDDSFAFYNQPRYFSPHSVNPDWEIFDRNFQKAGLQYAIDKMGEKMIPQRFLNKRYKTFVVWGVGNTFKRYKDLIEEAKKIDALIDGNKETWGKELLPGVICKSPVEIIHKKESFIMIAVQDKIQSIKIANYLNDQGILDYDFFDNWRWYRRSIFERIKTSESENEEKK